MLRSSKGAQSQTVITTLPTSPPDAAKQQGRAIPSSHHRSAKQALPMLRSSKGAQSQAVSTAPPNKPSRCCEAARTRNPKQSSPLRQTSPPDAAKQQGRAQHRRTRPAFAGAHADRGVSFLGFAQKTRGAVSAPLNEQRRRRDSNPRYGCPHT